MIHDAPPHTAERGQERLNTATRCKHLSPIELSIISTSDMDAHGLCPAIEQVIPMPLTLHPGAYDVCGILLSTGHVLAGVTVGDAAAVEALREAGAVGADVAEAMLKKGEIGVVATGARIEGTVKGDRANIVATALFVDEAEEPLAIALLQRHNIILPLALDLLLGLGRLGYRSRRGCGEG